VPELVPGLLALELASIRVSLPVLVLVLVLDSFPS
jgi:hypothetical protein